MDGSAPTEVQFPGGESFLEMRARVIQARDEFLVRHQNESIALVTHGGNIRILLAEALGIAPRNLFRIGQSYAGISRIQYVDGIAVVEQTNANPGRGEPKSG